MANVTTYRGSCHCGGVSFRLRCEPITAGIRCNCSFCVRKGAVMSVPYFPPAAFEELTGIETLRVYRFGDHSVNHYFCPTCGIYPLHDVVRPYASGEIVREPGHYRINLGCLAELDPLALSISLIDGRAF